MIKNYLITALRNLVKHKMNSAINITGLSIAFICSILIFFTAYYEFTFDDFHANKKQLFKVYQMLNMATGAVRSPTMGYPAAPVLKGEIPEIEKSTRYMSGGIGVSYKEKKLNLQVKLVDNDFLSMFSFPLIEGNRKDPLADVGNTVMSEYAAKAIFGREDPVGKMIKVNIGGEWKALIVSAITKDFPLNSSLTYDVLARPELMNDFQKQKDNWNYQNHAVFVQIARTATQQQVEQKMRMVVKKYPMADDKFLKSQGGVPDRYGNIFSMHLEPLPHLHFNPAVGENNVAVKSYLFTLIIISLFILAIACFNFINLNVARSFTRAKEVGVRKTLGAGRRQIFIQLWSESALLCLLALIVGIAASKWLMAPFNQLFNEHLDMGILTQPVVMITLFIGLIIISLITGGYPAWLMSKFNTVAILKGKLSIKKPGLFRNTLIIIQFTIACLLICCTLIIFKQFQYMRTASLGYDQQSVISIPIHYQKGDKSMMEQLSSRLASEPSVISITGSSVNLGIGKDGSNYKWGSGFNYNGKSINTNMMAVDYNFLKTLHIPVLQGRDFSREYPTDTINSVIVSESLAKQFGEKNIIGLSYLADSSLPKWNIIGVTPDFHLYSLHEKIEPLMLMMKPNIPLGYALIRVHTQNAKKAMDMVKGAYTAIEPGQEFQGSFLDENTNRWYEKEKKLSSLFGIAAAIAIVLSCLGLFAIASLAMQQRTKEIGIRKVLGATTSNIVNLLSVDFLKLVIIAAVIAFPVAWYAMHQWLQDFAYRISIPWWVFVAAGVVAASVAFVTISFQAIKAALANPVKNLRTE